MAPSAASSTVRHAAMSAEQAAQDLKRAQARARKAGDAALKASGKGTTPMWQTAGLGAIAALGAGAQKAISDQTSKTLPGLVSGIASALGRKKTRWQHAKSLGIDLFGKDSPGRKALAFGAGAGAIGLGIEGASSLHDAIADPLRKRKYMNNMLAENPQLRRENPKDVSKAFNTLYTFNKRMASDPLVSGSFLRRALQFRDEGVQAVDIKTLVDAHPKSQASSRFKDILPSTAKDLMSFVERAGGA